MTFEQFDADFEDPEIDEGMRELFKQYLVKSARLNMDLVSKKLHVKQVLDEYREYPQGNSNDIRGFYVFKPNEIEISNESDGVFTTLCNDIAKRKIEWFAGDEKLEHSIKLYYKKFKGKIPLGQSSMTLDALVEIDTTRVAIEVETSTNLENGVFSLALAVGEKMADFGIMITPIYPVDKEGSRASSKRAVSRIDNLYRILKTNIPIYSLSIVREIDIFKWADKSLD